LVNTEKKNEALSPETLKSIFHAFAVYMADAFSKLIDEYRLGILLNHSREKHLSFQPEEPRKLTINNFY